MGYGEDSVLSDRKVKCASLFPLCVLVDKDDYYQCAPTTPLYE